MTAVSHSFSLNYTTAPGGYFYRGEPAWAHGYPLAEQNLMAIMNEVSFLGPHVQEINSLRLDDPELCKYPVAYVIEPDWWEMTDSEARALRDYLHKGGFLIVDDFKGRNFRGGGGWEAFEYNTEARVTRGQVRRPRPLSSDIPLVLRDPIAGRSSGLRLRPRHISWIVRGQRSQRSGLQIIVNFNTDISQFWEWSGTGLRSISDTNESYKLGVNYLIYGLTH